MPKGFAFRPGICRDDEQRREPFEPRLSRNPLLPGKWGEGPTWAGPQEAGAAVKLIAVALPPREGVAEQVPAPEGDPQPARPTAFTPGGPRGHDAVRCQRRERGRIGPEL